MCGGLLAAAQAGEGILVGGVEGLALLATATATTEVTTGSATGSAAGSTTATAAASITAGSATTRVATVGIAAGTATTTTGAAASALRLLDEAVLELELLRLGPGPRPTPLLGRGAGEELLLLILGDGSELLPLAVVDTLVGLANLEGAAIAQQSLLLLGQLDLVLVEGDVLVLGFLLPSLALSGSLALGLLLGLGDRSASLLVLKLSLALDGAPRLGRLLLRVAAAEGVSDVREIIG